MKEDLKSLLDFLEKVVQEEDVVRHPYEVCIDCQEVAPLGKLGEKHREHIIIFQDIDHSGVSEWVRCLKWMLDHFRFSKLGSDMDGR